MALFGKILAVLNILAAVAFVYLASVDWAKRQQWAYAVYRLDLAVDGLPVDDKEVGPTEGIPLVERQSKSTLDDAFQGQGDAVASQRAEVERLHEKLKASIAATDGEQAKRQKLLDILRSMARNGYDRQVLTEKIMGKVEAGKVVPGATLEALLGDDGPLERVFKGVLRDKEILYEGFAPEKTPNIHIGKVTAVDGTKITIEEAGKENSYTLTPDAKVLMDDKDAKPADVQKDNQARVTTDPKTPGSATWLEARSQPHIIDPFAWAFEDIATEKEGGDREANDKRSLYAHLFFNVGEADEPQQRMLVVTGLRSFTEEANQQTLALQKMARWVTDAMAGDRYDFESRYREGLDELTVLAGRLDGLQRDLKRAQAVKEDRRVLAAAREADVAALETDLEKARVVTKKALAELKAEQQRLFQAQTVVGNAQKNNEKLLGDLEDMELKKKPQ